MIESILGSDVSSQVAEDVTESHPFADILYLIKDSIPTNTSFLIQFLKRVRVSTSL